MVARLIEFFVTLWHHRRIIADLNARLAEFMDDTRKAPTDAAITPERVTNAPALPNVIRLPRRTYAEEQARWEWEHNKKAREQAERLAAGFF